MEASKYMTKRMILLTGGARSGKSSYAEKLAKDIGNRVLYVATASPSPLVVSSRQDTQGGDEEMKRRIAAHKQARPAHWGTLETPVKVAEGLTREGSGYDVILIDCVTLLTNNVLCLHMDKNGEIDNESAVENDVRKEIQSIIDYIKINMVSAIIVTNEVGLGLIPLGASTRLYRDVLGRANQMLAQAVDEVYFMISGLPLKIKPQA